MLFRFIVMGGNENELLVSNTSKVLSREYENLKISQDIRCFGQDSNEMSLQQKLDELKFHIT
jgi:hypothetical protein